MESNWASEHLQTIRTLMERSALYRRALAPIMLLTGLIGIAAATIPCFMPIESLSAFSLYWMTVSLSALAAAFLLVRRQALKESEPFWSLPTRRVTQALLPGFVVGLVAGVVAATGSAKYLTPPTLAIIWIAAFGFAINAAGFFMQRGIKLLGWIFVLGAMGAFIGVASCQYFSKPAVGHYFMGSFFGVLQLAYGFYLYFTEKGRKTA